MAPRSEQIIHDSAHRVPIELALRPPLNVRQGHRLRVLLDGSLRPGRRAATRFSLQEVARGEHRLEVVVVDSSGKEPARSGAAEFHLWRASRQFEQRAPQ